MNRIDSRFITYTFYYVASGANLRVYISMRYMCGNWIYQWDSEGEESIYTLKAHIIEDHVALFFFFFHVIWKPYIYRKVNFLQSFLKSSYFSLLVQFFYWNSINLSWPIA